MARHSKPQSRQSAQKIDYDQARSQKGSYEIGAANPERLCTHCAETSHKQARCYDLIGYPDWWDPAKAPCKRNSKPNHQASVAVINPSNDVAEASSLIATSSNIGKIFHTSASDSSSSTWIIDSSATNHVTFDNQHVPSMKQSTTHRLYRQWQSFTCDWGMFNSSLR